MSTRSSDRPADGFVSRGGWRDHAACLDEDPELFFPVGTTGPALDQIAQAKAVCAGCSVRLECLEYALQTYQDAGVWGGLAEDERRTLRRSRRPKSQTRG